MSLPLLRTVQGSVLHSPLLPPVQIQVHPDFTYAGGQRIILYDAASAEQHLFVRANSQRRITHSLWIQFEGYLENNTYTYGVYPNDLLTLGGYPFEHDVEIIDLDLEVTQHRGSDTAQAISFLRGQGYRFDGEAIHKRLITVLGEDLRNELVLIYQEDLGQMGHRLADLSSGRTVQHRWPALTRSLHKRALASFTIRSA